jgi:thiamine biosynthesis lipoprotein
MIVPRRIFLAMTGAAALFAARPDEAVREQVIGGPAFASWWRASLPPNSDVVAIGTEIKKVIDTIDATMSPYRSDSELSLLNHAPVERWLQVSTLMDTVVRESLLVARLTDGAFDPTVGPLVHRFGFGPVQGSAEADFRSLETGPQELRKNADASTLDLCGIAKGYALDCMAKKVASIGVQSFLIEAGGEVFAHGHHPSGRFWKIAIETPGAATPRIVQLEDGLALATSGPAIQGGLEAGFAFNHIVDARTKRPVANAVVSVSVISSSAMRADALATALVVMGPERGLELARRLDLAVLFQLRDGTALVQRMSGRFARSVII